MDTSVNYVLSPLEGNINNGDPQGLKLYIQATKGIEKEADKLDISVPNAKDIIDHFLILANKYGWGRLAFTVDTDAGENKIFRKVKNIQNAYMHTQVFGYFGLQGIGNIYLALPDPLLV